MLVWFSSLFVRKLCASIFDLVLITGIVSALLEASLDPMLVLAGILNA